MVDDPEQFHPKQSHTCDRCLPVWPKVPYQEDETDIFRIGETAEELLNSACEVCQVLGTALEVHQKVEPNMKSPLLRWKRRSRFSGEVIFHDSDCAWQESWREIGTLKVWYPELISDRKWKGTQTKDQRVDLNAIKFWLDDCSKAHDRCRLSIQEGPFNLKVIDCLERVIIAAPTKCRYVALSYVWGGVAINTDASSALPSELPRTIEDSIQATMLLGYRYLWVDAFCIQQNNDEEKHRQIQQMDSIYISAELTLIAAAGDDCSSGLPGVSQKRRLGYRDATARDIHVTYVPPTVHRAITRSRWFTRGWTFQEGYLPRRRLYFTDSAVLFVCDCLQKYEGLQQRHTSSDVRLLEGTLAPEALGGRNDPSTGLFDLLRLLEQYTTRNLSYDYDALNAILGVLNYHHAANESIDTLWGIPYNFPSDRQSFMCINWTHRKPGTRRRQFPSWSPLGWVGSAEFTDMRHQFDLSEEDVNNISNHSRDEFGNRILTQASQYLRVNVKVLRPYVVNIIRSAQDQRYYRGRFETEMSYLVLAIRSTIGMSGDIKILLHVQWDIKPSIDYDSTRVICAVTHHTGPKELSMIVLQNHGTHYERIGLAYANSCSGTTRIIEAAGLDELIPATKGIQTLTASDSPGSYWQDLTGTGEEELAWIRNVQSVTITLG